MCGQICGLSCGLLLCFCVVLCPVFVVTFVVGIFIVCGCVCGPSFVVLWSVFVVCVSPIVDTMPLPNTAGIIAYISGGNCYLH